MWQEQRRKQKAELQSSSASILCAEIDYLHFLQVKSWFQHQFSFWRQDIINYHQIKWNRWRINSYFYNWEVCLYNYYIYKKKFLSFTTGAKGNFVKYYFIVLRKPWKNNSSSSICSPTVTLSCSFLTKTNRAEVAFILMTVCIFSFCVFQYCLNLVINLWCTAKKKVQGQ